jgi:hypothetical protein
MGLEERRRIKQLEGEVLPGREAEIAEICGTPIPYDVDWASFESDLTALNFVDNISCHRLNMALRVICADDLGKEAVRDGVAKVRLRNVQSVDEKTLRFESGVLDMACAYAAGLDGAFSDDEIRSELMSHL